MSDKIKSILKLLRINQWVKNIFIFLPVFFAMSQTGWDKAVIAFIAFSFVASSIYIFNDLFDVEEDRLHPEKKNRPIAANKITRKEAILLIAVCFLVGMSLFLFLGNIICIVMTLFYAVMNVCYTIKLKHVAIVDIVIIALGFLIRVAIGGVIANVHLSHWIVLMTFLLALFLAVAKRRDDVIVFMETGQTSRKNISGYNIEFINATIFLMASTLVVSYIMYTVSDEVIQRYGDFVYLTSFFVIIGIIRYFQITFVKGISGNPTAVLLKDVFLQLTIILWIVSFVILYNFSR